MSNFRPLMMLNTDFKILVKISVDRLQTTLPCLIGPEQCCILKERTTQNSLHMVHMIIEKVDILINLDQSKSIDGFDYGF